MFKLELINSMKEFSKLKDEWDELLNNSSSDNIFLTWEWQFNWWRAFNRGRRLHIILARNESNQLVGIAPLYINPRKILKFISYSELRFIGSGDEATSEYLDVILHKGIEEELIESFFKLLFNNLKPWHMLILSDMQDDSEIKNFIIGYINRNKFYYLVKEERPFCPIIRINSDWNSYIGGLSKLMRHNLRSSLRKIEREFNVEVSKFDNIYNSDGAFAHLQRLYAYRRIERKEKNKYISRNYKEFQENIVKSISDRKWLHLCLLSLNNKVVAALYCFNYKNKLYFYQMGSDNYYAKFNVSQNLMCYVLEDAIKQKITECDLLRGEEWYKMRWANTVNKKIRIVISNCKIGRTYIIFSHIKNKFFRLLKRILPRKIKEMIEKKAYK